MVHHNSLMVVLLQLPVAEVADKVSLNQEVQVVQAVQEEALVVVEQVKALQQEEKLPRQVRVIQEDQEANVILELR